MSISKEKNKRVVHGFSFNVFIYTCLALLAFAGNSVLCRLALGENTIDATSFTIIRLFSGSVVLVAILSLKKKNSKSCAKGSWLASIMLFIYALAFSFAYISLDTGTGALILFGSVQITMIFVGMLSGNRLHRSEWFGLFVAFLGFIYLVLPSLTTPSVLGFILMTLAGIAWGIYTLNGRGTSDPLSDTCFNFLRSLPFIFILFLLNIPKVSLTDTGILLAILSGVFASGIGYTIWYMALKGLSVTQASVVQLLVPVLATLGGVIFAHEVISLRLAVSTLMVLGGIAMVVLGGYYFSAAANNVDT